MTPLKALTLMGYDLNKPQRGHILMSTGPIKTRRYAFRYRIGDGHILTRLGRVLKAEDRGGVFVFDTEIARHIYQNAKVVWVADGYPIARIIHIDMDDDGDWWLTLTFDSDHKDVRVEAHEVEPLHLRDTLIKHGH